ncbi:MAG: zinc metalloprotease HtpX [Campylobacterota bacterium]|nr:zinc metalloprotease HtpX [Campylobacterota bacterium]
MRLKKELLFKRKILNIVHSFVIIAGTALLLSIAAFLIFGFLGIISSIIIWFLMIFIIPLIDPKSVLKTYDSTELSYNEVPNLYEALYNLSKNANLQTPPKLYYIKSNSFISFSTGTKENSAIALSDGIFRLLNDNELYGVLAHEISHIKNNDIWIMQITDIASKITTATAYIGQFILVLLSPFLILHDSLYFWVLFIIFLSIPPITIIMQLSLSRIREYGADIDAVMLTNDVQGLKNALLKLDTVEENILNKIFNPFARSREPSILRTHPDSKKRIKRLEELDFEKNCTKLRLQ